MVAKKKDVTVAAGVRVREQETAKALPNAQSGNLFDHG